MDFDLNVELRQPGKMEMFHKIKVQAINSSHVGEILKIQKENDLSFWSATDYLKQINNESSINLIASQNNTVVGYLISSPIINYSTSLQSLPANSDYSNSSANELEIYNIAVREQFQNTGIGTFLLFKLFEVCRQKSVAVIWLEVRETNIKARNFYRKHDFAEVYKRKNYYRNSAENAVVMKLELKLELKLT